LMEDRIELDERSIEALRQASSNRRLP
jgi:hypothetical protein